MTRGVTLPRPRRLFGLPGFDGPVHLVHAAGFDIGPSGLSGLFQPRDLLTQFAVRLFFIERRFRRTVRSAEPQALHGSARKGRKVAPHHAKNPRHRIGARENRDTTHTFAPVTGGTSKPLKSHKLSAHVPRAGLPRNTSAEQRRHRGDAAGQSRGHLTVCSKLHSNRECLTNAFNVLNRYSPGRRGEVRLP